MKVYSLPPPLRLLTLVVIICKCSAFHDTSFRRLHPFRNLSNNRSPREGDPLLGNGKHATALSQRAGAASLQEVPSVKKRRLSNKKKFRSLLFPILTALLAAGATYASTTHVSKLLGWRQVLSSSMVLIALGALPLSLTGMGKLTKSLLVSASRCAAQVSLLGCVVLQKIMGVTHPEIIGVWILGVGLISGRECLSRIQYEYPNMRRTVYGSVLVSAFLVLGLALGLNLFGQTLPWYDPKVWIPIAGMLFGNTLNAISLGTSSITKQFATNGDAVELRFMRGASNDEATAPLLEESFRMALLPTINGLAASGIIHIPGMMSGQILAGQSPPQASMYQIVINFLIAANAIMAVQLIIHFSVASILDKAGSRLRSGILTSKADSKQKAKQIDAPVPAASSNPQEEQFKTLICETMKKGTPINVSPPVLEIDGLEVPRANAKLDISLRKGDRIAISGKSGTGKSQILRTILGLEESRSERKMTLFGNAVSPLNFPAFRSKVCMVTGNRPTIEGTPNQFFEEVLKLESQQERLETIQSHQIKPGDIVEKWGLEADALDREWRTLSGGETQRAGLAIALALQPDVLLLDESTSFMDEADRKSVV